MDYTTLTDEQRALLELILDPSHLEALKPEEIDAELRALGADPLQEPSWRRRALAYLERKRSFISQETVPADGYAQLGAAAKHKASKVGPERRRFKLTWQQGEHEWSMEGVSAGESHELRLSSKDGRQPSSIMWKNPLTGSIDRFGLKRSQDEHILVDGITLAKAQKLAEALQQVTSDVERNKLLPIVLLFGETE